MKAKKKTNESSSRFSDAIWHLREALRKADAVVIGAGSGLSTAAGYVYTGERFQRYFGAYARKYGIQDMYSGGFYPFDSQELPVY